MICFPSLYEQLHQHNPSTRFILIRHLSATRERSSPPERTQPEHQEQHHKSTLKKTQQDPQNPLTKNCVKAHPKIRTCPAHAKRTNTHPETMQFSHPQYHAPSAHGIPHPSSATNRKQGPSTHGSETHQPNWVLTANHISNTGLASMKTPQDPTTHTAPHGCS